MGIKLRIKTAIPTAQIDQESDERIMDLLFNHQLNFIFTQEQVDYVYDKLKEFQLDFKDSADTRKYKIIQDTIDFWRLSVSNIDKNNLGIPDNSQPAVHARLCKLKLSLVMSLDQAGNAFYGKSFTL